MILAAAKFALVIAAGPYDAAECEAMKRVATVPGAEIIRYHCVKISDEAPKQSPMPPRKPKREE